MANDQPDVAQHYQHFFSCFLLLFLLPLVPLLIEFLTGGEVKEASLSLVACLYILRLGATSRNFGFFIAAICVSILQAISFGQLTAGKHWVVNNTLISTISIGLFFLGQLLERWVIHIKEKQPYFQFRI
jgi:hypothetical protein